MSIDRPRAREGSRLCIAVRPSGVTVYANQAALQSISEDILWISLAPSGLHYESHLLLHVRNDDALQRDAPSNAYVLFDRSFNSDLSGAIAAGSEFDITFMSVSDAELDTLDLCQGTRLLPKDSANEN